MLRPSAVLLALAAASTAGPALAQADAWKLDCAPNPAGVETCVAQSAATYRTGSLMVGVSNTMLARVRDDAQKPLVAIKVSDVEVRYAQIRIEGPNRSADMSAPSLTAA